MKHHNYSLPSPRDADDIFKVMGSKVKVTDNIFRKCTFPRRHTDLWFSVKDHIVYLFIIYYIIYITPISKIKSGGAGVARFTLYRLRSHHHSIFSLHLTLLEHAIARGILSVHPSHSSVLSIKYNRAVFSIR